MPEIFLWAEEESGRYAKKKKMGQLGMREKAWRQRGIRRRVASTTKDKLRFILFCTKPHTYMHMNTQTYTHRTAWHGDSLLYWNFWLLMVWRRYIVTSKVTSGFTFFSYGTTRCKEAPFRSYWSCNNCTKREWTQQYVFSDILIWVLPAAGTAWMTPPGRCANFSRLLQGL